MVVGAEVAGWVGENVGGSTGSGHKRYIERRTEAKALKEVVVELTLLRTYL